MRSRSRGLASGSYEFAALTALGAFLLFLIQPLIGRLILPWFGSTPAVWATSMVVFQSLLLLGYSLAHALARWSKTRRQGLWHVGLALLAVALLPITPAARWKPSADTEPMLRITLLLVFTIGVPFVVLAAGGPLLQRWYARVHAGRSPYRLYALSNLGSMVALLGYPVALEPSLTLRGQAWLWSGLYLLYVALLLRVVARLRRIDGDDSQARVDAAPGPGPGPGRVALWIALAACGSALLLASTNQMCQDVAVIPFLWILPLAIYLLSFVLCFERARWYRRRLYLAALPIALLVACAVLYIDVDLALGWQLVGYSAALFVCCMLCHGELYRLRPAPARLTGFYLCVAAGGAAGGVLVAIAAPLVFTRMWDYHLALLATYVTLIFATRAAAGARPWSRALVWWALGLVALAGALAANVRGWELRDDEAGALQLSRAQPLVVAERRGFYGVIRVEEVGRGEPYEHQLRLQHGRILHGMQFADPERRVLPTSYYGPRSGLGLALRFHPGRAFGGPLRVGVIGLGAGTVASYGKRGDRLRFYEINPDVVHVAHEHFSFLADAQARGADVETLLGDARLVLERQRDAGDVQGFDVLALDAFSSDAIPIHLLTRECFELYWAHMAEDGIVAVNISNRHLDLRPVVLALAQLLELDALLIESFDEDEAGVDAADWVLLTRNQKFVDFEDVLLETTAFLNDEVTPLLWRDDYSSVYALLLRG